MTHAYDASAAALMVFLALAAVDGIYLHLWRYRLHTREASRSEHRLHTLSAGLFAATLPALFLWETAGCLLWTGLALVVADLVVSLFDIFAERDSRADLGGLSSAEYALHMVIMSARGAAVALALAGRPATAWAPDAPLVIGSLPGFAATVGWQALPGAVLMTALHVWLCTSAGARRFEALRERVEARLRATPCCADVGGCCPSV